jgi:hypothetical protein
MRADELFAEDLQRIRSAGLHRALRAVDGAQDTHLTIGGRRVLSLCSNNYLGLANHPALIEAACAAALTPGTGGNRLLENAIRDSGVGVHVDAGGASLRILQNNITGNGVGLENHAPAGVLDATLNWWGSMTGPYHPAERPSGLGDRISDASAFDTAFVEFLCAPAPGGFPSIGGVCPRDPDEELHFLTFGHSPDVSPTGRWIAFVSEKDLNGDDRLAVDNADGGEEIFALNRRPLRRPGAYCIGGRAPGQPCTAQRDCPRGRSARHRGRLRADHAALARRHRPAPGRRSARQPAR